MVQNRSVLQPWVTERCTWKMQTVLMCALRGPDAGGDPEIKDAVRWIRRVVLWNAAPHKTFMRGVTLPSFAEIAERNPLALDMLPVHFIGHLMHAFEVIAYRYPDEMEKRAAWLRYWELCEFLHVAPEPRDAFEARLADEIEME
jgi:hypothetical protein